MTMSPHEEESTSMRFVAAPTRTITAAGAHFVYRELGDEIDREVPLVALTHLGANLDSWDPELIDALATQRRVILIGYRGVGSSSGTPRDRFDQMAQDAIAAIRALGLTRVDLFGLSMGGMVVQEVLRLAPDLVDRVILAGTGPQGGPGLTRMTGTFVRGILRGAASLTNPTTLLFFTRSDNAKQAAEAYQARLKLRRIGRDKSVRSGVVVAQLRAVNRWGQQPNPSSGPKVPRPVLILHGDSDRMVSVGNADALLRSFPQAQLQVFPDSGHGVAFQNRQSITGTINQFLRR